MDDKLLLESLKCLKECGAVLGVLSRIDRDDLYRHLSDIREESIALSEHADYLVTLAYREHGIDCDPPAEMGDD